MPVERVFSTQEAREAVVQAAAAYDMILPRAYAAANFALLKALQDHREGVVFNKNVFYGVSKKMCDGPYNI